MRGIEPRAFHMQSERSTTELHPLASIWIFFVYIIVTHQSGIKINFSKIIEKFRNCIVQV